MKQLTLKLTILVLTLGLLGSCAHKAEHSHTDGHKCECGHGTAPSKDKKADSECTHCKK